MPLISIVITVHNLEKYIAACLDSIVVQANEVGDVEVIVVDDASTDRSLSICREYAAQYSFVRVIALPAPARFGRAHTRGFDEASGEYVWVIDGDDFIRADCLPEIVGVIRSQNPDIVMTTFTCVLEPGGIALHDARYDKSKFELPYADVLRYLANLPGFHSIFCRYIFRKAILNGENLFYSKVPHCVTTNDWLPMTKILANGKQLYYLETPAYYYRRHGRLSVTGTTTNRHAVDHFLTVLELICYLADGWYDAGVRAFVFAKLRQIIKIALSTSYLLTLADLQSVAAAFDAKKEDLAILQDSPISDLSALIAQHGALEGLLRFIKSDEIAILSAIPCGEPIYIFPTGLRSIYAYTLFSRYGMEVKGFLDNDKTKHGDYMGVSCMAPADLQADDVCVFVCSVYDHLEDTLVEQLRELGLHSFAVSRNGTTPR